MELRSLRLDENDLVAPAKLTDAVVPEVLMRAVLQRVSRASVTVNHAITGQIHHGWLVLLGVGNGDTETDVATLADKIIGLRAFEDAAGKMNLAVTDVAGAILVVSQFTLYGDCRKGRRPSFTDAAPPDEANRLYELFCDTVARANIPVAKGVFRADMKVELINDGPVTLVLDTRAL